jgi:23S rRNA (cytosine1962-C5)-methyltransferase
MPSVSRVYLRPGRDKSLRRRHPWIFSGAVDRVEGEPGLGDTVAVVAANGDFLAYAAYSPASQIRLRVWSFAEHESVDAGLLERRVRAAVEARQALGTTAHQTAYRLVFGESDGLPGLVVDQYGAHLACQFLAAGAERWREELLDVLEAIVVPQGIVERSEGSARRKEGFPSRRGLLRGAAPPERIEYRLGSLRLLVDLTTGQKTGAYLDQALNYRRVAAYASGRKTLDAYAYGGAFALSALSAGAVDALLIDSSARALELADAHAALNGLDGRCRAIEADVPRALRQLAGGSERFDLIILDPPKFVHTAEQVAAGSRAYKDVNRVALGLLNPGGILATFSCSGHVDAALFQKILAGAAVDAGRDTQIVERLSQPPDHPVSLNFPESDYLTGLIVRVPR